VLYAYHVHTSDYGSAARTMFELAFKLESALGRTLDRALSVFRDPTRAEALDRLARLRDAYLAAVNALKLMVRTGTSSSGSGSGSGGGSQVNGSDARDAFVLMPRRAVTLKRSRAGTDEPDSPSAVTIDLLGPEELEQRYAIVLARLALVEARPEEEALHDLLSPAFTPSDAVQVRATDAWPCDRSLACGAWNINLTWPPKIVTKLTHHRHCPSPLTTTTTATT
jgi:hypothetical protein